jgi:hypothetical protein
MPTAFSESGMPTSANSMALGVHGIAGKIACVGDCPPAASQILGTPPRHEPRTPLARPASCSKLELLAPVYGWFTEGLDTRNLMEAKALLGELVV